MHCTKPSLSRLPSQLLELKVNGVPASMGSSLTLLQLLFLSPTKVPRHPSSMAYSLLSKPVLAFHACTTQGVFDHRQSHAQSCIVARLTPLDTSRLLSPDRAPLGQLLGRAPAPAAQRALLQRRQLVLHIAALQRLKLALQVVAGTQLRISVLVSAVSTSPPQPPLEDHGSQRQ